MDGETWLSDNPHKVEGGHDLPAEIWNRPRYPISKNDLIVIQKTEDNLEIKKPIRVNMQCVKFQNITKEGKKGTFSRKKYTLKYYQFWNKLYISNAKDVCNL
jgi:hypothetical protein